MPAVARVAVEGVIDVQTVGTAIMGPGLSPTVTANGSVVAVVGDIIPAHVISTPPPAHPASTIAAGSSTVLSGGLAVARVGDATSDIGAPTLVTISGGASNVIVG